MSNHFKLTIELVPQSSWYNNLRSLMPKENWQKLSKQVLKDNDYRCAICSSNKNLECHEFWEYDDINKIQRLASLQPLCELCHAVKHIGRTKIKSQILYESAVAHFLKLNNCSRMDFETHRIDAFKLFEDRSKFEWRIDIGKIIGVNSLI